MADTELAVRVRTERDDLAALRDSEQVVRPRRDVLDHGRAEQPVGKDERDIRPPQARAVALIGDTPPDEERAVVGECGGVRVPHVDVVQHLAAEGRQRLGVGARDHITDSQLPVLVLAPRVHHSLLRRPLRHET